MTVRTGNSRGRVIYIACRFPVARLYPSDCAWCRYFTVPILMLVLHMEPLSGAEMAVTAVAWAAVDAAAAYMFLWRPFSWPDGTVARFMW